MKSGKVSDIISDGKVHFSAVQSRVVGLLLLFYSDNRSKTAQEPSSVENFKSRQTIMQFELSETN